MSKEVEEKIFYELAIDLGVDQVERGFPKGQTERYVDKYFAKKSFKSKIAKVCGNLSDEEIKGMTRSVLNGTSSIYN